jgi:hypothetical protein
LGGADFAGVVEVDVLGYVVGAGQESRDGDAVLALVVKAGMDDKHDK